MKVAINCFAKKNETHGNFALSELRRLQEFQAIDRYKVHSLTKDVDAADIIILVGPQFPSMLDFRRSKSWRCYSEKCFVYNGADKVLPLLPGIYVSLERRFHSSSWTRSGSYLRVAENNNIQPSPFDHCDLLFSFAGAISNHPTRKKLLSIRDERSLVTDTSKLAVQDRQRDGITGPDDNYITSYTSMLERSKFILCPRGLGVSSWRLFEALKAGRVPVIISDQWVPPDGPGWDQFSVRVAEDDVSSIPALLASRENEAKELARKARMAWDEWFSADVLFHQIVESCLAIKRDRRISPKLRYWFNCRHLARPHFFRHWLLSDLRRLSLNDWKAPE